ncbi:DUF6817 domain-containing protein [Nocardia sp. NPDC088792]|uniref:DUF6817 domain-containing protein n=1 Tax=Nocardia sp. NPDC088792 TaxID=3364332 RepID=UPI003806B99F
MLVERKNIEEFLRSRGADRIAHPGGTLLAHLNRVADLLAAWNADEDIRYAGLCHAMYGTDGFNRPLLELSGRDIVVALIGERAESLVYFYCSCDRSAVYPRLGATPVVFTDRFTGRDHEPDGSAVHAFMEITAANELDVMAHNAELAAEHGPALYRLFERTRRHLSPQAWRACSNQLAPKDS